MDDARTPRLLPGRSRRGESRRVTPSATLTTVTIDGTDYTIEGGGAGTDAVFEHTTLATHTQTANIANTDALAVTLDACRRPGRC